MANPEGVNQYSKGGRSGGPLKMAKQRMRKEGQQSKNILKSVSSARVAMMKAELSMHKGSNSPAVKALRAKVRGK